MTTTETLRVSEPRDVLTLVPFQLGFTPIDSLVLVSMRGPRNRIGLVMRIDLPPKGFGAQVARELVHHALRDGACSTVLVVYSDTQDPTSPQQQPFSEVLDALTGELEGAGVGLEDIWHVGRDRYHCLTCAEACCPAEGFPVVGLQSSVLGAEMTYRGLTVAPSRSHAVGDLEPVLADRRRDVEEAVVRNAAPAGAGRELASWRRAALATWRAEVARAHDEVVDEVDVEAAGVLLAALEDLCLRDAVMLACVPGSGLEPERFVAEPGSTPEAEALFDQVFGSARAVRPDHELVRAATHVLRSLGRQASGTRVAPAFALLAWLAWWGGEGVLATDCAERALDADPDHRLAALMAESLGRGVPPGWAQRDRDHDLAGRERF